MRVTPCQLAPPACRALFWLLLFPYPTKRNMSFFVIFASRAHRIYILVASKRAARAERAASGIDVSHECVPHAAL
jgi:hypothetical protein